MSIQEKGGMRSREAFAFAGIMVVVLAGAAGCWWIKSEREGNEALSDQLSHRNLVRQGLSAPVPVDYFYLSGKGDVAIGVNMLQSDGSYRKAEVIFPKSNLVKNIVDDQNAPSMIQLEDKNFVKQDFPAITNFTVKNNGYPKELRPINEVNVFVSQKISDEIEKAK